MQVEPVAPVAWAVMVVPAAPVGRAAPVALAPVARAVLVARVERPMPEGLEVPAAPVGRAA